MFIGFSIFYTQKQCLIFILYRVLRHKHLIRCFNYKSSLNCIILEYAFNSSLANYLEKMESPLGKLFFFLDLIKCFNVVVDMDITLKLLQQLCSVLCLFEEKGIIHRNIKAENILVCKSILLLLLLFFRINF